MFLRLFIFVRLLDNFFLFSFFVFPTYDNTHGRLSLINGNMCLRVFTLVETETDKRR